RQPILRSVKTRFGCNGPGKLRALSQGARRMAQVIPDPKKIKSFRSAAEFEKWLSRHHDRESELWLRVFKKDSGQPTVTTAEALDVVLCWCWIDGIRKSYDESSFLQRYSPSKPKSICSDINRNHVATLIRTR